MTRTSARALFAALISLALVVPLTPLTRALTPAARAQTPDEPGDLVRREVESEQYKRC